MPKHNDRGFLILAVNSPDTDYVSCAAHLAQSIKFWHPAESVCLLTDKEPQNNYSQFDIIKCLPFGNCATSANWQLDNDWQVWAASPYRMTIKLEADMILTSPIDHWWTCLQQKDLLISLGARNYFGQKTADRFYRKVFDQNHLPDVYNALTYWKKSWLARDFFRLVRHIFADWAKYRSLCKNSDPFPTTDMVYALAAQIIGREKVTDPGLDFFTVTHMKKHIVPIVGQDWTKEFVWEFDHNQLRINSVPQTGFFHYHIKSWTDKIEKFTRTN